MATIYRLTIDPIVMGFTKPIDKVYIKNLYVDTDDTHIRTAPFEYVASVISDLSFVELPPTTLGSIYQLQLFDSEGMVLSVFFGMPKRNTKLSELDIFTAYPPRSYYPEASVAWGQLSGAIANQTDLVDVMFTKSSASAMQAAIDSKNSLQDTAINSRATTASVNAKNALQDTAISENLTAIGANKSAINLKVDGIKTSTDAAIALRAKTSDVNAKNELQDAAIVGNDIAINSKVDTAVSSINADITLKANIDDVNAKNATQDAAITAADNLAKAAIPKAEKGAPNGVATLDVDGKISPLQIPTEQPIAWGNITGNIADQTDLVSSIPDLAKTTLTYTTTTTDMPNLTVDTTGTLKRSTQVLGTAATKNIGIGNDEISDNKNMLKVVSGIQGLPTARTTVTLLEQLNTTLLNRDVGARWVFFDNSSTAGWVRDNYRVSTFHTVGVGSTFDLLIPSAPNNPTLKFRSFSSNSGAGGWLDIYNSGNTTKDSNGFIKAASPIVKVFADKVELNTDAENQNVTYKKNGVGDYTITTVSGLSTDGWYIELPKDMNGNPKVAVTLSEVDGVISLKSYKRIFSMETFTFEPDLEQPLDIPEGRWIDLRLNEIKEDTDNG